MFPMVHQIKGGASQARRDGKPHTGGRKPTKAQMSFLTDLRRRAGSDKTHTPDTKLDASDEIELLERRLRRRYGY